MDWLNALVNAAYAAALDSDLWKLFADQLSIELQSIGGIFIVLDPRKLAPREFQLVGRLEGLDEEYASGGWWQFDPQIPRATGITKNETYSDASFPDEQSDHARAYRNWESGWGSVHHLTSVGLLDDGAARGCFSLHYGRDGYTDEARTKLKLFAPHLNRALELGFEHKKALSLEYWRGIASKDKSKALMLLNEKGRVIHLTEAAETIARQNDGVRITAGYLRCAEPAQEKVLHTLVDRARGAKPTSGAMRVTRPSGRMPFLLTVFPLPPVRRALAPFEAVALVQLVDPAAKPANVRHLYRQAFELTERETDLAAALVEGHSPETAAATLNITVATARIHLRRLFQKTGTNRQSELIRLLIQIG